MIDVLPSILDLKVKFDVVINANLVFLLADKHCGRFIFLKKDEKLKIFINFNYVLQ